MEIRVKHTSRSWFCSHTALHVLFVSPFTSWVLTPGSEVIIITLMSFSNTKENVPAESPVLIQSGLAMLAMAKMSAARKRHPDITVSLSMSVRTGGVCLQVQDATFGRHWPMPLSAVPSSQPAASDGSRSSPWIHGRDLEAAVTYFWRFSPLLLLRRAGPARWSFSSPGGEEDRCLMGFPASRRHLQRVYCHKTTLLQMLTNVHAEHLLSQVCKLFSPHVIDFSFLWSHTEDKRRPWSRLLCRSKPETHRNMRDTSV